MTVDMTSIVGEWVGGFDRYIVGSYPACIKVCFEPWDGGPVKGEITGSQPGVVGLLQGVRNGLDLELHLAFKAPAAPEGALGMEVNCRISDTGEIIKGDWVIMSGYFAHLRGAFELYREGSSSALIVGATWPPRPIGLM